MGTGPGWQASGALVAGTRPDRGAGPGCAHLLRLAPWPCWPLREAKSLVRKRQERQELPAGVSSPQHLPGALPRAQVTDW